MNKITSKEADAANTLYIIFSNIIYISEIPEYYVEKNFLYSLSRQAT